MKYRRQRHAVYYARYHIAKVYWGVEGIWSIGYFVSMVGTSEEVIRKYIEMQGEEDSGQAMLEL